MAASELEASLPILLNWRIKFTWHSEMPANIELSLQQSCPLMNLQTYQSVCMTPYHLMTPCHSSKSQLIALLSLCCRSLERKSYSRRIWGGSLDCDKIHWFNVPKAFHNIYEQFVNAVLDHIWQMSNEVSAKRIDIVADFLLFLVIIPWAPKVQSERVEGQPCPPEWYLMKHLKSRPIRNISWRTLRIRFI